MGLAGKEVVPARNVLNNNLTRRCAMTYPKQAMSVMPLIAILAFRAVSI